MAFSFHDFPELLGETLMKHPEVEFVQLQINYLDWESQWIQSWACYETVIKHGKQVALMGSMRGENLAKLLPAVESLLKGHVPEASILSWAVRFAVSLPNVMVVLSGMSSMDQMPDNTSFMTNPTPIKEQERALLDQAVQIINGQIAIPVPAVPYCTEGALCISPSPNITTYIANSCWRRRKRVGSTISRPASR